MGTSSLICIYHNGRFFVAQYVGHDGYPSVVGEIVMESLTPRYVQRLRVRMHLVRQRSSEDNIHWTDPVNHLEDDIGDGILDKIAHAKGPLSHVFSLDFAKSSCCEWTYVVDLDAEVLEVYYYDGGRRWGDAMRGRLAEVNVQEQRLQVSIPFIDLPGDKEELIQACMEGTGNGED